MIYYLLELQLSDRKDDKLLRLGYHSGNKNTFDSAVRTRYEKKYRYLNTPPVFYTKEIEFSHDWACGACYFYVFSSKHIKSKFEYLSSTSGQGFWLHWSPEIISDFTNTKFDDLVIQFLEKDIDILDSEQTTFILDQLKNNKSDLLTDWVLRDKIQDIILYGNYLKQARKKYKLGKTEFDKKTKEFLGYYNNILGDSNKLEFYCDFLELYPSAIDVPEISDDFKIWAVSLGIDRMKDLKFKISEIKNTFCGELPELQRYILSEFKPKESFNEKELVDSRRKKFSHLRKLVRSTFTGVYVDLDLIQNVLERYFYTRRRNDAYTGGMIVEIMGYKKIK